MFNHSIDFEIKEMLGEGSQGQVYRALRRDPATGLTQTVALKILHSETAVDAWKNEFNSLAKVRSPYCVQVFGFERVYKRPALVLEFIDGISLATLGRACWLHEDDILEVLAQCEAAVLDLYKFGAFHGDLSPHNILIDGDGCLRLLDFGWANCSAGMTRATPEFAAPERLCGEPAAMATDIFSIGRIEQFLRASGPEADPSSPYLHSSPERRRLRGLLPMDERRAALGEKVRAFQQRQILACQARTQTQNFMAKRSPISAVLALMIGILLLSVSGTSRSEPPPRVAVLQIRTHLWHHFRLDGQSLGYSPLDLPIEAGRPHLLEWTSSSGKGAREVRTEPGRIYSYSDRDFSH